MLNTRSQGVYGKRSVGEHIIINVEYDMICPVSNTVDILVVRGQIVELVQG